MKKIKKTKGKLVIVKNHELEIVPQDRSIKQPRGTVKLERTKLTIVI